VHPKFRHGGFPSADASPIHSSPTPSLLCQVLVVDGLSGDGLLDTESDEPEDREFKCKLENHEMTYSLDLPQAFVDEHPHVGNGHVSIVGARPVWEPDDPENVPPFIFIPANATISMVYPSDGGRRHLESAQHSKTHGNKTVLILRVSSPDGTVELTKEQLSERTFGIGENVAARTVTSQYSDCSYGKLNLVPAQGNGVVDGVLEMNLASNVVDVDPEFLEPIVAQQAENALGIQSLDETYDHIMFVFPWGTRRRGCCQKWYGFAYIGGQRSFYNNDNAGFLSIVMHEIGHNYNLWHSSEGRLRYGDTSCIMGSSYRQIDIPQRCFNGFKNHQLGWFADKTKDLNVFEEGAWTGNIAAITNYDVARPEDYIVVKVHDIYLQFNRANKFNLFTGDYPNQITIVLGTSPDARSSLLGAVSLLNPSLDRYPTIHRIEDFQGSGSDLVIEACEQDYLSRTSTELPDIIRVSVHLDDGVQTSMCFPPTPSPTASPTLYPTPMPSSAPSSSPSEAPSSLPSAAPSSSPSSRDCTGMDEPNLLVPVSHQMGNRTCQWISDHKQYKKLLCQKGYEAFEQCQETCDSCNAQGPEPTTSDTCEDSRKMLYVNAALGNRRCFEVGMFLERNPYWKVHVCAPDAPAYDHCPEACGACKDTCEDQPDKTFYVNRRQGHRDCAWLAARPLWRAHLCKEGHDANRYCNESCDTCM
jgi:hypothetical protein